MMVGISDEDGNPVETANIIGRDGKHIRAKTISILGKDGKLSRRRK